MSKRAISAPEVRLCDLVFDAYYTPDEYLGGTLKDLANMRTDGSVILHEHYPCVECCHNDLKLKHILSDEEWDLIEVAAVEPSLERFDRLIDIYIRLEVYTEDLVNLFICDPKIRADSHSSSTVSSN